MHEAVRVIRLKTYVKSNKTVIGRLLDYISFTAAVWCQQRAIPKADIIIGTSPTLFAAIAAWKLAQWRKVPFVFEVRDLWPDAAQHLGVAHQKALSFFYKVAQRMYHDSTAIVTVGEGYKRQISQWHNVPETHIHVLPNSADPVLFKPTGRRREIRQALNIEDKFAVFYIGNHGLSQKLEHLLYAADAMRHQPDIHFVLIGDGCKRDQLRLRKEQLALSNITMLSAQPREDIPAYYDAADCCVIPLADNPLCEGTVPVKLYEAIAMRRPVIFSGKGSAVRIVEDAHAGIAVPPEDSAAMVRAIESMRDADPASLYQASAPLPDAKTIAAEYLTLLTNLHTQGKTHG